MKKMPTKEVWKNSLTGLVGIVLMTIPQYYPNTDYLWYGGIILFYASLFEFFTWLQSIMLAITIAYVTFNRENYGALFYLTIFYFVVLFLIFFVRAIYKRRKANK